jgi:hypothetical protein
MGVYCATTKCRLRLSKCKRDVITEPFHSVGTKHRSLALPSENACARKAASVVAPTRSGSRSSKLLFLAYRSELENVAVSFVFVPLLCSKSELVRNFQH